MYQKRESRISPVLGSFCFSLMTVPWPCCGFISRFLSAHPAWSLSTVFPEGRRLATARNCRLLDAATGYYNPMQLSMQFYAVYIVTSCSSARYLVFQPTLSM